jgi:ammonium transporter, Amt family
MTAAGFVAPLSGALIGAIAGFLCYFMVAIVKNRFGYDDSLDAFGVHGIGGLAGCLLTGVFGTRAINDVLKLANGQPAPVGWVDGNVWQVLNQAIGAGIGILFAVVGTFLALKVTDFITPVRVSTSEEDEGMDIALHGEEGYTFED